MVVPAVLANYWNGTVSSRSPAMIPRLSVFPKGLSFAIAKRIEEAVENCSCCKKHHCNDTCQALLKILLLGEVQQEAMVVDGVNPAKLRFGFVR